MANVAKSNTVLGGGFNPLRAIDVLFTSLTESFAKSREFQKAYNELSALNARELNDLGISRSDITRIAYGSIYGDETDEFKRARP